MLINKIRNELEKRKDQRYSTRDIVSDEFKLLRDSSNRTLDEVSKGICSPSYWLKIEQRRATPSMYILREVFKGRNLSDEQINTIMNLNDIIKKCIKGLIANDPAGIAEAYKMGTGLSNVRFRLVELCIHLISNNLDGAKTVIDFLEGNVKAMSELDLELSALFTAIYHYKNNEAQTAQLYLSMLPDRFEYADLELLRKMYLFYVSIRCNSDDVIRLHSSLVRHLFDRGYRSLIDYVDYLCGVYMVRNKSTQGLQAILDRICTRKYQKSLRFLISYHNNTDLSEFTPKLLTDYCLSLKGIHDKEVISVDLITKKKHDLALDVDFEEIQIRYLMIDNDEARLAYFNEVVIDYLQANKNRYLTDFFLNDLYRILCKDFKYRDFCKYYEKLMR